MKKILLSIIAFLLFASSYSQYKVLGVDTIKPNKKTFTFFKRKMRADSIITTVMPISNSPDSVITTKNGLMAKTPMATIGTYGSFTAYASGTTYNIINATTGALVDFGTVDPSITLTSAGTYLLYVNAGVVATGYSNTSSVTVTIFVRRTNNTATNIANATQFATVPIATLITDHIGTFSLPPVYYTTALTTDILQVWALVSAYPYGAGILTVNQCSIVAIRQY